MRSIRRSLKNDRASPPASAGSTTSHSSAHHVLGSGNADKNGLNGITVSKPGQGKTPPKSVIRAITGYRSRSPQELSFEAGDFFHVVGERGGSDQQPEWFDAANPLTGARGLVPAHCFQVLGRNEKEGGLRIGTAGSATSGAGGAASLSPPGNGTFAGAGQGFNNRTSAGSSANEVSPASGMFPHRGGTPSGTKPRGKHQPLYGVVQYDFRAERADELDAKKGESIIVIAQSNHEWFVAKPIGRLGGPGLIPVSFVAISDTTTGEPLKPEKVREMVESGMVPPVEEWKKMTAEYKQASIPLGRFDFSGPATPATVTDGSHPYSNKSGPAASATSLGSGQVVRPPSGPGQKTFSPQSSTSSLQHNRQPSIAQQYLQKHTYSQDNHPAASSSSSNHLSQQSDSRRQEFSTDSVGGIADQYFQNGDTGPDEGEAGEEDAGAYYEKYGLVTSATVESFHSEEENYWFHLRVNFSQSGYTLILYRLYDDFLEFQYALMDDHPIEAGKAVPDDAPPGEQPTRIIPKMPGPVDFVDEVVCAQRVDDLTVYLKGLCSLPEYMRSSPLFYEFFVPRPGDVEAVVPDEHMQARWEAEKASDRERDREMASSAAGVRQRGLDEEVVEYLDKMQVGGNDSGKHGNLPPLNTQQNGPFAPGYSLSNAPHQGQHQRNQPSQQSGHISPTSGSLQDRSGPLSAGSGISFVSPFAASNQHASTSTTSLPSQGRSTPQSAPPPFVKIKIFHRNTDDLIAIRVPPNIKLDALLDKVRERLGGDVEHVRYRDDGNVRLSTGQAQSALSLPGGTRLIELRDDSELDAWIRAAQRLVAYVD